jgi:DNA polymerase-3 subunit delta'
MSILWDDLWGHDELVERFRRTLQRGRLASTYLFVGPPGIGKRQFAIKLAQGLLCTECPEASLEPCGQCTSCRLFAAGNHPDLDTVGMPPGKTRLPISLFLGDDQHRYQEGLCHRIALKPVVGRRRVAIIDDADHFNQESANCLLKTLEEPPPHLLLILIGTSPSRQLPTIRSRAQVVRFQPLAAETVARILLQTGVVTDPHQAANLAEHSEGSVRRARELADPELWRFRDQMLGELASSRPDSVRLARAVQTFVDEAGGQAAERRERLRTVISFAGDLYRAALRAQTGAPLVADTAVQNALAQSKAAKPTGSLGSIAASMAALDRCLEAIEHVDRNANLGLVIQTWCDDLAARAGCGQMAPVP